MPANHRINKKKNAALELLRGGPEGIKEWNHLRETKEYPAGDPINLIKAGLIGAYLNVAYLSEAD